MFGDNEAYSTHYWGPTTLICILPPAVAAGLVPVTIKENKFSAQLTSPTAGVAPGIGDEAKDMMSSSSASQDVDFVDSILNSDVVMFNYRDDTDRELMELALQIVGMKLTGRTEDAKQIAMAILNQVKRPGGGQQQGGSGSFGESKVLETLEGVQALDTPFEVDWSLQTTTQQTMLHLATILNWPTLCAFLIQQGIKVDLTDRNEFTALHFASWLGRSQILKMLYLAGARPELRNAFGLTAKGLTDPKIAGIWDVLQLDNMPPTISEPLEGGATGVQATPLPESISTPLPPAPSLEKRSTSGETLLTSSSLSSFVRVEKQRRRKRDRMTFTFWLPLFIREHLLPPLLASCAPQSPLSPPLQWCLPLLASNFSPCRTSPGRTLPTSLASRLSTSESSPVLIPLSCSFLFFFFFVLLQVSL